MVPGKEFGEWALRVHGLRSTLEDVGFRTLRDRVQGLGFRNRDLGVIGGIM